MPPIPKIALSAIDREKCAISFMKRVIGLSRNKTDKPITIKCVQVRDDYRCLQNPCANGALGDVRDRSPDSHAGAHPCRMRHHLTGVCDLRHPRYVLSLHAVSSRFPSALQPSTYIAELAKRGLCDATLLGQLMPCFNNLEEVTGNSEVSPLPFPQSQARPYAITPR